LNTATASALHTSHVFRLAMDIFGVAMEIAFISEGSIPRGLLRTNTEQCEASKFL